MVSGVDRIVIAVPELDSGVAEYRQLLGCSPLPGLPQADRCCFDLNNTVVELALSDEPPGLRGLVFACGAANPSETSLENSRGLDLRLADASATAAMRAGGAPSDLWVDHLVLRTGDADGCIELFAQQLGIRLALDQNVPEWGGRMLFFRTGKLTLEVIAPNSDAPARDAFWGIAYRCADIEQTSRQLAERGVELSSIRSGRKAGTRVMTVKSHCLGIPTLLIQQLAT
jgi:hypothetical protein